MPLLRAGEGEHISFGAGNWKSKGDARELPEGDEDVDCGIGDGMRRGKGRRGGSLGDSGALLWAQLVLSSSNTGRGNCSVVEADPSRRTTLANWL